MRGALLTTREVAELIGMTTETVLRRFRSGEIPGFRISTNALRFDEREVTAWLDGLREHHEPTKETRHDHLTD